MALLLLLAPSQSAHALPPAQPAYSPADLIAGVNSLRASNGLGALKANSALMAAAQAQSDYQAATGSISHTGKGGSNARGRAAAYGYGSGAAFYVSENIAAGMSMSASGAVSIWTGDGLHLGTMLNAAAVDIGAGEASNGDLTYYTILVGYVTGADGSAPAAPAAPNAPAKSGTSAGTSGGAVVPAPTLAVIKPIQLATPGPDGTLVHIVEEGQALWNIAAAYQVALTEILAQNGLTDKSLIFPGEKLVIRRGVVATAAPASDASTAADTEASPSATPPNPPTVTPQPPERTPTALALADARAPATEALVAAAAAPSGQPSGAAPAALPARAAKDPLLLAVGGLLIAGALLLIFGSVLRRA
jgi:LysM repeat protein